MKAVAEQAGYLSAHAIWCVSDGEPLIPLIGAELEGGKQTLLRFLDEEKLERAVEKAKEHFLANQQRAVLATLIYDGYVTLPDGKTDALVVEGRAFCEPPVVLRMLVPYRSSEHPDGFAVFRPKFLELSGPDSEDPEALGQAFFAGVDSHEKGADVWNRYMDQGR